MSVSIGSEFIEKTKYKYLPPSPQQMGVYPPSLKADLKSESTVLDLPDPKKLKMGIKSLIDLRQSVRQYSDEKISREELSYLLWCTQGVKEKADNLHTFRTVPSAGARHAFETFLYINKVNSMDKGLYYFNALEHKLNQVYLDESMGNAIYKGCFKQSMVKNAAVVFMWICDIARMTWRYSHRGYRYVFIDVGHVCQNLYLCAEAIDIGVCAIAAFDDDVMNNLLNLDGQNQFTIYLATAGKL